MNSITRSWLTWKHKRKFTRLGKSCRYPITNLTVDGHLEQGDRGRLRNNSTFRTHGNGKIIFGNRAGCSWGCLFEAWDRIEIGDYSGIAEYTVLCDTVFDSVGNTDSHHDMKRISKPIIIGSQCFIGSNCYIGPGVTIGDGAVVAHHSIVTRDVGPYEIWGGTPARKMGHRTEGVPEAKMKELERLVEEQGIQTDRYLG